jgi:Sugar (and other) transporter
LGFDTEQQLLFQAGWLAVSFSLNCAAITIVDRMARNKLMAIGLTGCLASLIVEAAIQARYLGGTNKSALAAGVAMLYSYVFFYAMFLDGCSFWYVGEIFPSHLRANGFALAMAGFCLADIIWLGAAPTAFAQIGWKYYLFFIIITLITTLTVYFKFPNTLNVPLEEVAKLFGDDDQVASSSRTTFEDEKAALEVETAEHVAGHKEQN